MIQNQTQKIDARHYNGYLIIPGIVYHLTSKSRNSLLIGRFGKPLEVGMINFIARYGNCMQRLLYLKIHGAYCKYVDILATYVNECTGDAQIIPVTMFLVTLYNVCFTFQCNKKRSNLLITALDVFNLGVRKYARAEGLTLPPSEELCPSGGSNSPAAGAQNLTQFGEKGKNDSVHQYIERYGDVPRWHVP